MHTHSDVTFTYILVWLQDMNLVPSHVVPSLTVDKEHNDVYSAYNKPGAVMYWLRVRLSCYLHASRQYLSHQGQSCLAKSRLQQLKAFLQEHTLSGHTSHIDMHALRLGACALQLKESAAECCNIKSNRQCFTIDCGVNAHTTASCSTGHLICYVQQCLTPSSAAKAC